MTTPIDLSYSQKCELRRMWARGSCTSKDVAERFGITRTVSDRIIREMGLRTTIGRPQMYKPAPEHPVVDRHYRVDWDAV